jgi:hypothetical protein
MFECIRRMFQSVLNGGQFGVQKVRRCLGVLGSGKKSGDIFSVLITGGRLSKSVDI